MSKPVRKKRAAPKKRASAKKTSAISRPSIKTVGLVFTGFCCVSALALAALFTDFKTLPQTLEEAALSSVKAAGFGLEDVDVSGAKRFSYRQIVDLSALEMRGTIFGQDLRAVQERLEAQNWIKSARVSRDFPNRVRIAVEENIAFARWRIGDETFLINPDGQTFLKVRSRDWTNLPLVVGRGAPDAAGELANTITQLPHLKERLVAATRVGHRRWDLTFKSGATVRLPEQGIAQKLAQLDQMNRQSSILDGMPVRIDMRMDQMLAISTTPKNFTLRPRPRTKPGQAQLTAS